MVIVEGCFRTDNGRTAYEVANSLPAMRRQPPIPVSPDPAEMLSYMSSILGGCVKSTRRMVFDGFPLTTELAYGQVLRGSMAFTSEQVATLQERLRLHDPLYIYCFREPLDPALLNDEASRARCTAAQLRAVMSRYERMFQEPWAVRVYRHNLALPRPGGVVEAVRGYLAGLPGD